MTKHKLYLPSHPLYLTLHPLYLCHQTHCIYCISPTLCMTLHTIYMTSHSVCIASHEQFMTSHPYRYASNSVYLWYHVQYIWYHPYCFMKTKRLYLASHPQLLTSQTLHLCGLTSSINAFTTIMVVFSLGTGMTSYTPYITTNSDFMT